MSDLTPMNIANAEWLAHRYIRESDCVWFRRAPRAHHSQGPFLIDDLVGECAAATMTRADAVAAARAHQAPVHFLFHSAFCASTLLCRALDHSGVAMGLSEPVLLNDVVGVRRRREMEGRDVGRLLDDSLTLLARGWGAGEAVILKPSCVVNPLGAGMLTLRPDAKALCLYAPLDQFLSSVARKELWCRLWVRELLEGLIGDGVVDLGFTPSDYFRLTDLQCAAVGWLAQHRLFAALAERFGADRVRTMDSEMLLTDPKAALAAIAGHFSLATSAGVIAAMADAPAFRRHSKSGESFDADARRAERTAAETAHGDELAKVHEWALVVAERAGVSIPLPHPLLQAS